MALGQSLLNRLGGSPVKAPDWQLNRVVSAQDSDFAQRGHGVNAGEFNAVRFAVVPMTADPTRDPDAEPGGAANPSIEIRVWVPQANAFVPMPGVLTRVGAGAGEPYVFDVPNANGSVIGCFVTNDLGGEYVAISVQGIELGGSVPNAATIDIDSDNPIPIEAPTPIQVEQTNGVLSMIASMVESLIALAATIASGRVQVTPPAVDSTNIGDSRGFLSTLAGAITGGSMKAVLQAGSALIGKVDLNPATPYIDTITAVNTAPTPLPNQAVKGPVFLRAHADNTSTVTITDGTRVAGVVLKKGEPLPVHVTNLNQITYTFAVGASTEKLIVSTGI